MDAATLAKWNGDFAAGVALYAALGSSAVYKRLFASGETGYSRQVLERELKALQHASAPPAPVPAAPLAAPAAGTPLPASPELLAARKQLRQLYDERTRTHAQLTAPRLAKLARGEMAFRILDLTEEIEKQNMLCEQLATGTVPAAPVVDETRRLVNLRCLRSKLKKRPDRAADLAAVEAQIAQLKPTTRV